MEDRLKKFIEQNRQEFDTAQPPADLWQKIDEQLGKEVAEEEPKHKLWNSTTFWRVAAIFLLGISTIMWLQLSLGQKPDENQQAASLLPDINLLCEQIEDQDFCQAQDYYATEIIAKKERMSSLAGAHPELMNDFLADVDTLGMLYDSLTSQFAAEVDNQALQTALISNLRIQLEILDRQISVLEKMEAYTEEKLKDEEEF